MTEEELKVSQLPIDELMVLAKDAARYRWLRDAALDVCETKLDRLIDINRAPTTNAEFDATVDSAMEAE